MYLNSYLSIAFTFLACSLFAQVELDEQNEIVDLPKQDFDQIALDFTVDNFIESPTNKFSTAQAPISTKLEDSRGFTFNLSYPFNIIKKNVRIAIGIGMSNFNLATNVWTWDVDSTNNYYNFTPDSLNFKKNKLLLNYVEIPLALRFMSNPNAKDNSFRIAVGYKVGYMFRSYTKVKYSDVKRKDYNIKRINPIRHGVFARIGFGKYFLTGFYSLTPLFEPGFGPELVPYSVGLSILTL
ncbi:MAG: outer membrane beta-barrel protein [Bacteroidia bacterium]|nr:outer membrane beta-barrel protein [Bacteroidia bacterium]